MKKILTKTFHIMVFFFTPEDSERQIDNVCIDVHIGANSLNLGAAKAIFWLGNGIVLFYLLTLL